MRCVVLIEAGLRQDRSGSISLGGHQICRYDKGTPFGRRSAGVGAGWVGMAAAGTKELPEQPKVPLKAPLKAPLKVTLRGCLAPTMGHTIPHRGARIENQYILVIGQFCVSIW